MTAAQKLAAAVAHLMPGLELVQKPAPPPPRRVLDLQGRPYEVSVFPRNIVPNTPQRRVVNLMRARKPRNVVEVAGRRGSKTQCSALVFIDRMLEDIENKLLGRGLWAGDPHPPWEPSAGKDPEPFLHYFVISPINALNDEPKIALRKYLGHIKDREPGLIVDQGENPSEWWVQGGVRVDFLSGDRPLNNVSHGYNGGWFGEAARLKPRVYEDNLAPALSDKLGWTVWDTTPLGRNWFYQDVWAHGDWKAAQTLARMRGVEPETIYDPKTWLCVSWTTADNDSLPHLKEEMERARLQLSDANFRRNYLADFEAFEGQVFDMTSSLLAKARWTRSDLWRRIWAGFDPGMNHRASYSITVEKPSGGYREIRTESSSDVLPYGDDAWHRRTTGDRSTWANRLWAALYEVVGDRWGDVPVFLPHDRPDIAQEWERYGFNVQRAFQEHEPAVTWMQTAIRNGMFEVTTEALFTCMTTLRFPGPGESSKKLWVDRDDDEWDSERYSLSEVIRNGYSPLKDGAPLAAMGWKARR